MSHDSQQILLGGGAKCRASPESYAFLPALSIVASVESLSLTNTAVPSDEMPSARASAYPNACLAAGIASPPSWGHITCGCKNNRIGHTARVVSTFNNTLIIAFGHCGSRLLWLIIYDQALHCRYKSVQMMAESCILSHPREFIIWRRIWLMPAALVGHYMFVSFQGHWDKMIRWLCGCHTNITATTTTVSEKASLLFEWSN